MPVKQEKDSISISVEVKYISHHGGGIGKLDEVIYYPAPDEVRSEVQRLLKVVQDKKMERDEPVFGSIEVKLESIDVNIQKLKDPKQVSASAVNIFMKDLREREKYVRNCMSEAEYCCWCIETSKPRFLAKELQEFDNCLENFNKLLVSTLEEQARNSIKKTQSEKRDNCNNNYPNRSANNAALSSANNKELASTSEKVISATRTVYAAPPPQPATAISEQKKDLTRSNAMPKTSEKNSSDQRLYGMPQEVKGQTEIHQRSYPTQRKDVMPHNFAHTSISSNTSRDVQPNNLNTPREHNKGKDQTPPVKITTMHLPFTPENRVSGLDTSRETNRERDSASASRLKPSGRVDGLNTSRESNKEKELPTAIASPAAAAAAAAAAATVRGSSEMDLDRDSAKMPKLKMEPIQLQNKTAPVEIEPIQLTYKPPPVMNFKKETIQLQNKPDPVEIEPIQLTYKPPPVTNFKKEAIQLQIKPDPVEIEPIQLQRKPATIMEFKMEPIQLQNKPAPMGIEPIQLQTKPAPIKEFGMEPAKLQNCPTMIWDRD